MKPIVAVSCESIVAFSQVRHQKHSNGTNVIHSVAVADLNLPHQPVVVHNGLGKPEQLLFSSDGKQLLVATDSGMVKLLSQKSGPLQEEWEVIEQLTLDNETVLAMAFFHDGVKPTINLGDVVLTSRYNEKFSQNPYKASLLSPGDCPTQGFIVVTATGIGMKWYK